MGSARYDEQVGLCATCCHASMQRNARGSAFWRCVRAERDPRLLRYPPLPVERCFAHEAGTPGIQPPGPQPPSSRE